MNRLLYKEDEFLWFPYVDGRFYYLISPIFENHLIPPKLKKVCDKKGGEV